MRMVSPCPLHLEEEALGCSLHIMGSVPYKEEEQPQRSDWMQMSLLEMQMTFLQRALGMS